MSTQEQLACIFCGRSTILKRIKVTTFENWSIDWKVLQVRQILPGPGRGIRTKGTNYGFPAIKEEGLSILEMMETQGYEDLVEAIRGRLIRIVRAYIEAGIIKREEI